MVSVLFVCLGNICRSPTAEGVFRRVCQEQGVADQIRIDSAGTANWHAGKPPDARAVMTAKGRGVDISGLRARQATAADFYDFDFVIAMDDSNVEDLEILRPVDASAELHRFLAFAGSDAPRDVPDPYYGGDEGFEQVLDLVTEASRGLLNHLRTADRPL